jgi:hypothetical protein
VGYGLGYGLGCGMWAAGCGLRAGTTTLSPAVLVGDILAGVLV